MFEFKPFITSDGSVGLYSVDSGDIYHSAVGAVTESYYKYILPANVCKHLLNNEKIHVLDLCYGIGYNSKSFLNLLFFILNKNLPKKNINKQKILSPYIDMILTDNMNTIIYNDEIYGDKINKISANNLYNDTLYSDKYLENFIALLYDKLLKSKISITAIDIDSTLGLLSPFIKNSKISKKSFNFYQDKKLQNLLEKNKFLNNSNSKNISQDINFEFYHKFVNMYIYDKLIMNNREALYNKDIESILSDKRYKNLFDPDMVKLFHLNKKNRMSCSPFIVFWNFLHNIYYKYISYRNKIDQRAFKMGNIDFELIFNDARKVLSGDNKLYDIIFLDAFTPTCAPSLWTIDFIKCLYTHVSNSGMILTYTSAAPVRKAFIDAGLNIGKIYNKFENRFSGTIASKDKSCIEYPLSDYEIGILETKAGIPYKDFTLSKTDEEILNLRKYEVEHSNLLSATEYKRKLNLI